MKKERFETVIAAYGASPRRWPEGEREEVLSFLAAEKASAGLAEMIREAEALDVLLDAGDTHPAAASPLLRQVVMAGFAQNVLLQRTRSFTRRARYAIAAGLVVALLGGAATGALIVHPSDGSSETLQMAGLEGSDSGE